MMKVGFDDETSKLDASRFSQGGPSVIHGAVSANGVPTITLSIAGQDWTATIDTGFSGDLELPEALRNSLNAMTQHRLLAFLQTKRRQSIWNERTVLAQPLADILRQRACNFILRRSVWTTVCHVDDTPGRF